MDVLPTSEETKRLDSVAQLSILDTQPEAAFDRITQLVARLFEVPIALVTLVDRDRQWFKSCVGLDISETPRSDAFCSHAIEGDEVFVVEDTRQDVRFATNPLVVGEQGIRFYAGAPLRLPGGARAGTLCVLDTKPRRFDQGQQQTLQALAAVVVDEMEFRLASGLLRESEVRKAAILETALDCIVSIDHTGHVLEWNPAAEKTFGWTRAEALECSLHQLIVPPELQEGHIAGLHKYLQTGEGPILGQRLELPAVCKDGRRIAVELAVVRVPDFEPPVFTGHLRDITSRKQQEDALRESESRYGRIAANVPGMIYQFVLLPDGTFSFPFVGEGCRDIYGIEPQQLQDNPLLTMEAVAPEDQASFYESIVESARQMSPWEWTGRIRSRGQGPKWIRGTSRPKREANGDIIWDGLILDVTAQQEAEIALEQAKSEAEQANQAKSEFLGRMSHELRTPLNAILGFGRLLRHSSLSEDDRESVDHIVGAGQHLLQLINEVLDIARIESGQMQLSLEAVRLPQACREVVELMRPLAMQRGIILDATQVDSCPCYVLADRQRLRQVLVNLLANAIKYNRADGRVTLECEPDTASQGTVHLHVHDTGVGIAPDKISRLFTPFDRLDAEQTDVEGTGVGLSLSRHLAELMQGTIHVQSQIGEGSTFTLTLPAAQDPNATLRDKRADRDAEATSLSKIVNTRRVVLYIEDNAANLRLMQRLLVPRPDIKLLTALQGSLGLDLAQMHCPDLILLDLHLPGMQGREVLRQLREEPRTAGIPVVVISADATPSQVQLLRREGAQAYLAKPFEGDEFWSVVSPLLNSVLTSKEKDQ